MSTLNIGGNEKDRFYRYKMPKLVSKIEGRGNGIKTVVPNMSDIARSLGRPPAYATKFFGCELGAQVKCDEKNDRYIVNGAHEAAKLQELLDVFIKKFVLCAGCTNPETDLIVLPKTDKIIRDCKACGQRTEVDMRHKLVTFILKNPPRSKSVKKDKSEKSDKSKKSKTESSTVSPTTNSSDGSDDELTRRIQEEAAKLPTAEETGANDEDWAVDTSAEAVRERMKDLEANITKKLALDDDGDDDSSETFEEWLEENKSLGNKEIYSAIKRYGIAKDKEQVLMKLVSGFFDESFKRDTYITKQIKKRTKIFQKFVQTADDQHTLLGAISVVVGVERKELFDGRIICKILMELYQNDILSEEVIQAWVKGKDSDSYKALFKKTADNEYVSEEISKEVRNKARPFARWLEEAEEEDDDDDDDEE